MAKKKALPVMGRVVVKCTGSRVMDIDDLVPFQGDLKSLSDDAYKKFRNQILKTGIIDPFNVWDDKILDGHQRDRVLKRMRNEGYDIPQVPVVDVEADNAEEAKRFVLSLASTYGKVDRQGLFEFMHGADIAPEELDDLALPSIDANDFRAEYFEDPEEMHSTGEPPDPPNFGPGSQSDQGKMDKLAPLLVKCPHCEHTFDARKG